jgi:UDP-N-acetylmuramoyl-tripeptide--D-alanyl-D-alanine ligase
MRFLIFAAFGVFAVRRLLTYLHIYQQEEYDSERFLRWVVAQCSFDRRASLLILIVGTMELFGFVRTGVGAVLIAVGFLILAFFEKDPRIASKKKLAMTGRAKRIYFMALVVLLVVGFVLAIKAVSLFVWILLVQLIPAALAVGNLLTTPYENKIQKRFWSEANKKLQAVKPTIIGITGSYGKTSTKHLLGHILEIQAPTLITPGSVNTPMGIARIVRERLGSHHRLFVCEMGAYGPGSIARLCRLAPPDVGVITAIGMAHYERFKTLEIVAQTKFELADAVAAKGGTVIIAEQALEFEAARRFRDRYRQKTVVVGSGAECALRIISSRQTESGIETGVEWERKPYILRAPIYGQHHVSNMAVAFATACSVGVSPEDAIVALSSAPQITHRLEVKKGPAGARMIDDAYNSNPAGFASGLQLLDALRVDGGRRILVTPGMVELGRAHEDEHRRIGKFAGARVDVLLAVVPERIKALTSAYTEANPEGTIVPCPDFAAAQSWLEKHLGPQDVVLLENDLPDLYERKLQL